MLQVRDAVQTFLAKYNIVHNAKFKSYDQNNRDINHGSNLSVSDVKYYLQDNVCFDINDF
ncbi:MAG: hypothetical protein AB8U16_04180 [Rickettsiales endosymbiont of Dermacentor nuttalli]